MWDTNDYSLRRHNTFGLDVRCMRFAEYGSVEELRGLLAELRECPVRRLLHIGGGSNLLFRADFDGLVLHSGILDFDIVRTDGDAVYVRAGAGERWDDFVAWTVAMDLYGAENLSLIPGEVGASAVQNIGAYGAEAKDIIDSVEAIDVATGEVVHIPVAECGYGYRTSRFKTTDAGRYIILSVTYRLAQRFTPNLTYGGLRREVEARGIDPADLTAADVRRIVIEVRRQKLPDPEDKGNAGSFFVNPIVSRDRFMDIWQHHPEMPSYDAGQDVKIPAGWLVEQCGWRGRRLGPAGVYDRQALVLVNEGGATGADIVALSRAIQTDVCRQFGVWLQPEVMFV